MPIIRHSAAGLVLLQKRQPFMVTAQRWPCMQIIMQQQDDMTRTREMQIQQLEMQGRKRRGRPPGSKNKPKSDVSGGLEIREFCFLCCARTVAFLLAGEACSKLAARI